jgi:hypothetical protein
MKTSYPYASLFFLLAFLISCSQLVTNGDSRSGFNLSNYDVQFKEIIGFEDLPIISTNFAFSPDDQKLIIIGQTGWVHGFEFRESDSTWQLQGKFVLNEVGIIKGGIGLTAVAFDPNFKNNASFYLGYSLGDNTEERISSFRWKTPFGNSLESKTQIIHIPRPQTKLLIHGISSIEFSDDNNLYITLGESNRQDTAQSSHHLNGKLLRIKPNHLGGYEIPESNPFTKIDSVRDEILSFGLRSPFRLTTHKEFVFIGDVGHKSFEELNFYKPGITNFGWPICEGPCSDTLGNLNHLKSPYTDSLTNPLLSYERSGDYSFDDPVLINTTRASIAVGPYLYVKHLSEDDLINNPMLHLAEHLFFFDIQIGFIRLVHLPEDQLSQLSIPKSEHFAHLTYISSMKQNNKGQIFLTRLADDSYDVTKSSWLEMKLIPKN